MKMKKGLLTMLALLSMGSVFAQDYSGPDAKVVAARKGVLRVQVEASKNYRDLQFDLKLPEGLALVPEWVPDETNVKSAATGHVIAYQPQSDGNVRFVVYDGENGNTFSSDGGVLIEIPVSADADFKGGDANVTGVITSLNDDKASSDEQDDFDIKIALGILGDVNEDGKVNVTDVVITASYVLDNEDAEKEPLMKNRGAADIDGGDVVNVTDVVNIANIALEFQGESTEAKVLKEEVVTTFEDTLDPQ